MADTKISAAASTAPLLADSLPLARANDSTARRVTVEALRGGLSYAADYGILADGDGDANSAALAAVLGNMADGEGGTLFFPPGASFPFNDLLEIPNDGGVTSPPPKQKTIRLTGAGAYADGHTGPEAAAYGTKGGSVLDLRYSGAGLAKIVTRGHGLLEIDHLVLADTQSDSKPFIQTTLTTLWIHDCGFYTAKVLTACDQDAIILGTAGDTIDNSDTAKFDGYGTVIHDNFFQGIRRAVYFRNQANGIQITNNTIWARCGSNLVAGAAMELDGPNACAGNYIAGNLFELVGYVYGVKVVKGNNHFFSGNTFFDAGGGTLACYRFGATNCDYNFVYGGYYDNAIPLVSDAATVSRNTVMDFTASQVSRFTENVTFRVAPTLPEVGGARRVDAAGNVFDERMIAPNLMIRYTPTGQSTENLIQLGRESATVGALDFQKSGACKFSNSQGDLGIYARLNAANSVFIGNVSEYAYLNQGNMHFLANKGPILTDRADGHTYRLKVTNGVLGVEQVS